jgi:hypothetical protein
LQFHADRKIAWIAPHTPKMTGSGTEWDAIGGLTDDQRARTEAGCCESIAPVGGLLAPPGLPEEAAATSLVNSTFRRNFAADFAAGAATANIDTIHDCRCIDERRRANSGPRALKMGDG